MDVRKTEDEVGGSVTACFKKNLRTVSYRLKTTFWFCRSSVLNGPLDVLAAIDIRARKRGVFTACYGGRAGVGSMPLLRALYGRLCHVAS